MLLYFGKELADVRWLTHPLCSAALGSFILPYLVNEADQTQFAEAISATGAKFYLQGLLPKLLDVYTTKAKIF